MVSPNIMAADNALMTAGYMLSMLTEPRPAAERVQLLDMALGSIQRAIELLWDVARSKAERELLLPAHENSVAITLYDAKRLARDRVVEAAEVENFPLMRKWMALVIDIDALAYRTIDLTKELRNSPNPIKPAKPTYTEAQ